MFDAKLERRPVIVLSNNDGCAVARTNEAKALGIKMGQPYFQIKHLCERKGVVAVSSKLARQLMTVVGERIVHELNGRPCIALETVAP